MRFQLRGNRLEQLVVVLRQLVRAISPHRRYTEYLSQAGAQPVLLPELKETDATERQLEETKPVNHTIKLFISYSHADEAHKKELELCLKNIKRRLPLEY